MAQFSFIDIDPVKWFDDLLAIGQNGTGVKLTWSAVSAWRGDRVEMLLRHKGITVYARQYTSPAGRDYGVTVRKQQAEWADYILRSADVPVTSPQITKKVYAPPKTSWGKPAQAVGFGGLIVNLLSTHKGE